MPADDSLRVEPDATALANALTSGAAAQFAAKLPAQPAHAAAKSAVDAAQAESMWAPSIAAGAAIRADALAAGAALAAHAAAVAKQNEQALSDTVADQRTERQRFDRAPGDGNMTTVLHPPQLGPAQSPHPPPRPMAAGPSRVVIGAALVSLAASLGLCDCRWHQLGNSTFRLKPRTRRRRRHPRPTRAKLRPRARRRASCGAHQRM